MYRVFGHYLPRASLVLFCTELSVLLVSVFVAALIASFEGLQVEAVANGSKLLSEAALFAVSILGGMFATGLYQRDQRDTPFEALLRIAVALLLGLMMLWVFSALVPGEQFEGNLLPLSLLGALIGITSCRLVYFDATEARLARRVLVLGSGTRAAEIARLRRAADRHGIDILGFVPCAGDQVAEVEAGRRIDLTVPLSDYVASERVEELVIAPDDRRAGLPDAEMLDCKLQGVRIIDLDNFLERQLGRLRLSALKPSQLLYSDSLTNVLVRPWGKRTLDIAISLFMVVLLSPVLLLTAALIKLDSRGPALYRQRRVGLGGEVFTLCKFRSMRTDAEIDGKARWATDRDPRITRVGGFIRKTRIDELPQLFNILRGDMSFVGPRPERPEFVVDLCEQIPYYELRHYVKPGLTGWAQTRYPYGASTDDARAKLELDLYYIKNYSFFLDLNIILDTVQVVLWRKGAR